MNNKNTPAGKEFVAEAYALTDSESAVQFYQKWATEYDKNMGSLGYISPQKIAEMLADNIEAKEPVVLDIGCGTGLTGAELYRKLSCRIDGIDISAEMIEVARGRGIYRNLRTGDLNLPLNFEDNQFDAAISSGTFTHGHVGPKPLREITSILKPGGLLACTVHFDLWHQRKFDQAFEDLVKDGFLNCLSRTESNFYEGSPHEGWFCIYQKSEN